MRLAKNIYNEEGLVLLGEHVELTTTIINRLQRLGIYRVYIEDPRTEDIELQEPLSDELRTEALSMIRSSFMSFMNDAKNGRIRGNPHLGRDFHRLLDQILDEMKNHDQAMIMLSTIQTVDHYLFQHSLNVCLYAIMLGKSLGYTQDQLRTLAMGAMLHDVGKTQVPQDILLKPGKLTDKEMDKMRKHTEYGFHLLKDIPNISLLTAHCALQHHERLNGSGYPRGIEGEDIHEYARLLGIVDTFDAMTTHRTYKQAVLPHQAVEELFAGSGELFDSHMVTIFRDRVAIYPPGMSVELSTGEVGVVVDINASLPHRPIVRILWDENGQELKDIYEIDLSKRLNVTITRVNEEL